MVKRFLIFILIITFLVSVQNIYCQFYVSDNAEVSINETFAIQESLSIINYSVTGQFNLTFNSYQKQLLETANTDITLPGLTLENTSLEINSTFTIQNSIKLSLSNVSVNQVIFLHGMLESDALSSISGLEHIQFNTDVSPDALPISYVNLFKKMVCFTEHIDSYNAEIFTEKYTNTTNAYNKVFYKSVCISQPTPPPIFS